MPVQEQKGGGGVAPNRSAVSVLEGGGRSAQCPGRFTSSLYGPICRYPYSGVFVTGCDFSE